MGALHYQPIGHDGYTCKVVSARGASMRLTAGAATEKEALEGDHDLKANDSLVQNLRAFASNEFGYRRARNADNQKAHRKSADRHRREVLGLVDLIDVLGDETRTGYCSACFELTEHRRVGARVAPAAYLCRNCGAATTPCLVPGCRHLAIRSVRRLGIARYCAEHVHAIPGFSKLDDRLESFEDYEAWLEFDSRHAKRITTMAGGLLGGVMIVGPAFLAAAPAIGGAIGAWTGLSGAAATSHGLALLGGGAVAAGGMGVAGGTAVVTAVGASLGGGLGASVASSYVGDDPSFKIEKVEDGVGAPVMFSSGFLTGDEHGWGSWETLIRARYPARPVYRLRWGAKELKDLRGIVTRETATRTALKSATKVAVRATHKAVGRIGIIGGVFSTAELTKNPWWVAKTRADMTGAVLADVIARTETDDRVVLVGHSLGARVMAQAARALSTESSKARLEDVHLLGAAIGSKLDLRSLDKAVQGTVWNYWSKHDKVLRRLYRSAQLGQHAAGAVGFSGPSTAVKNRNVSRQVKSHSDYTHTVALR